MKTHDLENVLNNIHDENKLDSYIADMHAIPASFSEYFLSLEKVKQMDISDIVKNSGIERTYCYHILDGTKKPGRDKIIRLCLAAKVDSEEARRALECAQLAQLYVKSKRDALIQYAFNQHLSVIEANILLSQYHEDPLD